MLIRVVDTTKENCETVKNWSENNFPVLERAQHDKKNGMPQILVSWNHRDLIDKDLLMDVLASHEASGADMTLPAPGILPVEALAVLKFPYEKDTIPTPESIPQVRINRYVPSLNLVRNNNSLKSIVLSRNRGLVLSLSEKCDMACRMCPFYGCDIPAEFRNYYHEYMVRRKDCSLSGTKPFLNRIDRFKEIMNLSSISVYGPGEPFFHPEIKKIMDGCEARGLTINFATNGNNFTQNQLNALANGSVGTIIFSLDAFSHETYRRIKPNGDLSLPLKAIKQLQEAQKTGAPFKICVSFIRQKLNAHEESEFTSFWHGHVDQVVVTSKYHAGQPESEPLFKPHAVLLCPHLENSVHVLTDGTCWSCSAGVPDEFVLGNIDHMDPQRIQKNLDTFVLRRIESGVAGSLCQTCFWWAQAQRIETWSQGNIVRVDHPFSYRLN